jgi:signal transduction histidine kinase
VFATGQERVIEFDLSAFSGIRKYYQARLVPEFSQDGSITSVLAVSRDITDRKQAEEEREQLLAREQAARAEAEAANRAKDDFLAMVSHDLRNPLSAILSYSQLLQTHSHRLDKDTIARALKTIERSAIFQGQLINDLLDISRITSGQLHLRIHPVDLVVVIEAAISTVSLTAQDKAIQIESALDPKARRVLGDRNRLQQVILNLLSNAIKFTPKGGRIQIQLTRIDEYVQVTVSDTGQGISAEFLPYVFDRFRQADNKARQQGLGLGLAIVRHLVELHEGTVHVESPGKGQGATFTIKLPSQSLFANG